MTMGRPRESRKDLPPGLYWTARRGYYFYRVRNGVTQYKGLGKIDVTAARREWAKLTARDGEALPEDGTVAEILRYFEKEALPLRVKKERLKQRTADEYIRQMPSLVAEFGAKRYALTPAHAMRPDVLRQGDITRFLDRFDGERGAAMANRKVATLSAAFSAAVRANMCAWNPCLGVERLEEKPRNREVTQDDRDKVASKAAPPYRLMLRLTEATGMRLTDVRNLLQQRCGDEFIDLSSSKTGVGQRWEITPAVRAILDEAATLPGRSKSTYVFPTPAGTPYTEKGVHDMRKRALKAAGLSNLQHRDIRKAAVREAQEAGMEPSEFAGHTNKQTTRKHYLGAVKVKPVR